MTDLSLKALSGIEQYLNEKEKDKALSKALEEQKALLSSKPKEQTLEDVLIEGGVFKYKYNDKKYSISVLTEHDLHILDNIGTYNDIGVSYYLPPVYKYHCRVASGNTLTVKCGTYQEAQELIDSIVGVNGLYRVSASKL